jgi:hypothetical protein
MLFIYRLIPRAPNLYGRIDVFGGFTTNRCFGGLCHASVRIQPRNRLFFVSLDRYGLYINLCEIWSRVVCHGFDKYGNSFKDQRVGNRHVSKIFNIFKLRKSMQTRHKNGKTAFYCKHVKENENVKKNRYDEWNQMMRWVCVVVKNELYGRGMLKSGCMQERGYKLH